MPKHIINVDRIKTWSVEGSGENWLLKANASITTEGVPALIVTTGSDGNNIRLLGDLEAEGAGAMDVILRGQDNRLLLGANASIEGSIGIHDLSAGNRIIAKGDITGLNIGIRSTEETRMAISGDVVGGTTGIEMEGNIAGSVIKIGANGSVNGADRGIGMSDGTDIRIINKGEISSDQAAIHITTGDALIINRGAIFGNVETGYGNDRIDTRKGTVGGEIHGGGGSDQYWISDASIDIVEENGAGGYDIVRSSATYALADQVEKLVLIGKADIDAIGNELNNALHGNSGDNSLSGGDGIDFFYAGGGRDELTGGTDGDCFFFRPGDRIDTVTDFENDVDALIIQYFDDITNFGDIEQMMSQHDNDVWIQLSKKDRIVLENVSQLDLDEADFQFMSRVS